MMPVLRHVQRGQAAALRLVLPHLRGDSRVTANPFARPALVQAAQARELVLAGGHDQLAADLVGDALLLGEATMDLAPARHIRAFSEPGA